MKLPTPAIVRRKYQGEWEYAIVYTTGVYSPFGQLAPGQISWVYQATWKDTVQRIHKLTSSDKTDGAGCWWNEPERQDAELLAALTIHAGPAPKL